MNSACYSGIIDILHINSFYVSKESTTFEFALKKEEVYANTMPL